VLDLRDHTNTSRIKPSDETLRQGRNPDHGLLRLTLIIGQILPKIIIDLNMPPGMVEVASSYVPLSRVKQLADIAILRDVDISALRIKPLKDQLEELSRLSAIFGETKRRYSHYFTEC
jgi:Leucine-rich repeat (LRR) protein